ncbi:MAG: T9SS type A sorting domain-containing protein [Chitinophagales bacterium]|nr:T9SS type A sorting domain-containing protein [Chitinophagales bacterium]
MKGTWILVMLLGTLGSAIAQQQTQLCGTDEYSFEMYKNHPHLQSVMQQKRSELKQHTANYIQNIGAGRGADSVLIVPVVVHVIHNYGVENISEAQVLNGLEILNRNFRNQHPDTGNIETAYKPIAADCEIEFRLAQKDPNGNCTNGINRIASPLTAIGDHSVKSLVHWDPTKYLNVYVVKQIAGLAGHCLMPDQAAAKPEWDGIVVAHAYFGNIGTSSELRSVAFPHEVGHYLNLFHIWGGNNVPGYIFLPNGQQSNCGVGDDVADTPPTIGWSVCSSSNASCGNTVDNYQNAMDYTYCNFMFTEGQKQRMRACLRSPVAGRSNLISTANLYATGVVNADTFCVARTAASTQYACVGDTISFFDKSLSGADAWEWNFGDGSISYEQHPKYAYFTEGNLNVVLKASKNGVQLQSVPLPITISNLVPPTNFVQTFEVINNFGESGLFVSKENESISLNVLPNVGYGSAKCGGFLLPDTMKYSGKTSLTSPALDVSSTPNAALQFNYYFTQKKLNSNDVLEVSFSSDCGKKWISQVKLSGASLRTVQTEVQNEQNYTSDTLQWKTILVPLPPAFRTSAFRFKIDYTNFYGNNLLIDNININPELYTSIKEISENDFSIFPNPVNSEIRIKTSLPNCKVQITDIFGKEILYQNAQKVDVIDVSYLSSGIYFITLFSENKMRVKKFNKY